MKASFQLRESDNVIQNYLDEYRVLLYYIQTRVGSMVMMNLVTKEGEQQQPQYQQQNDDNDTNNKNCHSK